MVSARVVLLIGLGLRIGSAQQGQPQKMEPPKWMSDEGKDLFSDLMAAEHPFDEATCELRENLLKTLTGKSAPEASQYRYMVLKEIGMCEFNRGNFDKAKKRLDSGISELNLPNDDLMLTNQDLAPVGLLRQATEMLKKNELTQAATALRRSREIGDRNLKKILKMLHKQMSSQPGSKGNIPPLENIIDELSGYGKTGQILPMLVPQAPILKQELPFAEQIDKAVDEVDKRLAGFHAPMKGIRKTLDTSKGQKSGSLLYARGLVSDATAPAERLMAAQEIMDGGAAKAFKEEAASAEKSLTLIKRTKEGSGCKEGKGMDKTCAALAKIPDLKSNPFGETRVVIVKAGKQQPLESCTTNANLGILTAAQDGVTATVAGSAHELQAGVPLVVDFCQEVTLDAAKQTAVLFAQAWHPEFAAVERTTELRSRAKNFDISEDEVKEATKIVNDFAKKNWEKGAKQWRNESPLIESVKSTLSADADAAKKKAEVDAEAKRKDDDANDEDRKANLAKLEAKRAEKKQKADYIESKRQARKKQLEEERMNRDPWLNAPEVLEAENLVADLKKARRDANAKLEFDLTAQLTKDISAAERKLKSVTKKNRKAFKKTGKMATEETQEEAKGDAAPASGSTDKDKATEIKQKLEDVKKRKAAAAESENFGEAKKLKAAQKDLEAQLKKLEL